MLKMIAFFFTVVGLLGGLAVAYGAQPDLVKDAVLMIGSAYAVIATILNHFFN